jgi:hypothetical protein
MPVLSETESRASGFMNCGFFILREFVFFFAFFAMLNKLLPVFSFELLSALPKK